jgi:hypothetical protein
MFFYLRANFRPRLRPAAEAPAATAAVAS